MTREAFYLAHKHQLLGMMLDAFLNGHRKGAEASMYLSVIQQRVMEILAKMYDDLQPKPATVPAKPAETANGKPEAGVRNPGTAGAQTAGGPRQ